MSLRHFLLFALLSSLIFASCRKDEVSEVIPQPEEEGPRIIHDASVTGRVIDESGNGVANSDVSYGDEAVKTDDYGYFSFFDVKTFADGCIIHVKAEGYQNRAIPVFISRNDIDWVDIYLEKNDSNTLVNGKNIDINLQDGIDLRGENVSFEYPNGDICNDDVTVLWKWYSGSESLAKLPFSIRSVDYKLKSNMIDPEYGLSFYFVDNNGSRVELVKGSVLSLIVEDQSSDQFLFRLDEDLDYWKKERIDDQYKITHSGIYSLGGSIDLYKTSGRLIDEDGNPIKNSTILLEVEGRTTGYRTNQLGEFELFNADGKNYELKIENECGNSPHEVKAYSIDGQDLDLGDVMMENGLTSIYFDLYDCDVTPLDVSDGVFIEVISGGKVYMSRSSSSRIELSGFFCNSDIKINIKNNHDFLTTIPLNGIKTGEENDLYRLYTCQNNVAGFIKIDESLRVINNPTLKIGEESAFPYTPLTFSDLMDFTISINVAEAVGDYTPSEMDIITPEMIQCSGNCSDVVVRIISYGEDKDDLIVAHVFGEVQSKKIECYFRAHRYN